MSTIWNPFAELSRAQRELMQGWPLLHGQSVGFVPPVDVCEEDESLVLRAELPGVKHQDIEVSIDSGVLTLRGERKLEKEEGRRYHRVERPHGKFVRQFELPKDVDTASIEAALADGVLTLKLPKRPELRSRKIEVKAN